MSVWLSEPITRHLWPVHLKKSKLPQKREEKENRQNNCGRERDRERERRRQKENRLRLNGPTSQRGLQDALFTGSFCVAGG